MDGNQTPPSPGSLEDLNQFRADVWDRIVKLEARVTELETPKPVDITAKPATTDAPESAIQTLVGELKTYGIRSSLYVEPATEEAEPPATGTSSTEAATAGAPSTT